jgi:hypothetical protein
MWNFTTYTRAGNDVKTTVSVDDNLKGTKSVSELVRPLLNRDHSIFGSLPKNMGPMLQEQPHLAGKMHQYL